MQAPPPFGRLLVLPRTGILRLRMRPYQPGSLSLLKQPTSPSLEDYRLPSAFASHCKECRAGLGSNPILVKPFTYRSPRRRSLLEEGTAARSSKPAVQIGLGNLQQIKRRPLQCRDRFRHGKRRAQRCKRRLRHVLKRGLRLLLPFKILRQPLAGNGRVQRWKGALKHRPTPVGVRQHREVKSFNR
jgi:hypothetical protein